MMALSKNLHCFQYYFREYPLNSTDIKVTLLIYVMEVRISSGDYLENIFLRKTLNNFFLPSPCHTHCKPASFPQTNEEKEAFYKNMLSFSSIESYSLPWKSLS